MTLTPPRILVVDDNRDSADILAELLRFNGCDAQVAYDGARAIAATAGFRPDVIFLDIGMPGMDGYDVVRALRAQQGSRPFIVALTAWNDAHTLAKVAEAGFDLHVAKPSSLETILAVVAEHAAPRAA